MAFSIDEIKSKHILSDELLSIIPHKCKCGNNLCISNSLNEIVCTSKKCTSALHYRTKKFCEMLNIPLSDQSIDIIIRDVNIISPYQILMLQYMYKDGTVSHFNIPEIQDCIQIINNVVNNEISLANMIKLCGIEEITSVANKLFDNFNSVDDIYEQLYRGQVVFISGQLGLDNTSIIFAVDIFNKLIKIQDELVFAETQFKIDKNTDKYINVAIIGNTSPLANKSEIIQYLNAKYKMFRFRLHGIDEHTDILINGTNSTDKCRDANIINNRFIAEEMNKNNIELNDIGKFKEGILKPIGAKIYIDNLQNVLNRLEELSNT